MTIVSIRLSLLLFLIVSNLSWNYLSTNVFLNVFSDSIAALLSIKDCNTKNSIARNSQYFGEMVSAFTSIKFYWCKGHNKIIGNEMADYFAKDSISNPNCLNQVFPLPISHVKNKVKSKSKTSWFNRWKTSTNGRITFSFIPDGMLKYLLSKSLC